MALAWPPAPASAAAQRMGIAAGSYRIGAGGSESLPAYCFDVTRDAPSPASNFDQVLTSSADATVQVDGKSIPLQQALAQHILRIVGNAMSFEDFLAHTPFRDAPPDIRAMLRADWQAGDHPHGDPTKIRFINLSGKPLAVNFGKPAVFGSKGDVGLPVPAMPIDPHREHAEQQRAIWDATAAHSAALLRTAGYAPPANDRFHVELENTVEQFQADHGLERTGQLDAPTERKLRAEAEDIGRLRAINANPDRAYAMLFVAPHSGHDALYRVHNGRGDYRLARTISDIAAMTPKAGDTKTGDARVFLVPRGLSTKRVDNLAVSAAQYSRRADAKASLGVVKVDNVFKDAFFSPAEDVTAVNDPELVQVGSQTAYAQTLELRTKDGRSRTMRIFAATKALLQQFLTNLQAAILRNRHAVVQQATAAQLITLALEQTRQQSGMSRAEFKKKMQAEMGGVQFADLAMPLAAPFPA